MKQKVLLILCLICLMTAAACSINYESNESNESSSANKSETASPSAQPAAAASNDALSSSSNTETDNSSSNVDDVDVTVDWVDEALKYVQSLDSTTFHTEITELIMNESGDQEQSQYITQYDGELLRSPVQAYVEMSFDSSPYWHKLYIDEDRGHFLISHEDSEWQLSEFQPEFKTIERIEELIQYFAEHRDKLTIAEQEDIVYIELQMDHDEFVVDMELLTTTIFNDSDYYKYEYEGTIPEGDFLDVSFSEATLVMDPSGTLTGYIVRYTSHNTSRLDDTTYGYEYLMVVDLLNQNFVEPIVIPEI